MYPDNQYGHERFTFSKTISGDQSFNNYNFRFKSTNGSSLVYIGKGYNNSDLAGTTRMVLTEYAYMPQLMSIYSNIPQIPYDYAKLSDTKNSASVGGSATAGSWFTRTLNTVDVSGINDLILNTGNNTFYLPSGTYDIHGIVSALQVNQTAGRLFNVDTNTEVILGTLAWSNVGATQASVSSHVIGRIITSTTGNVYRLEQRVYSTQSNSYALLPNGSYCSGVMSLLEIKKVNSISSTSTVTNQTSDINAFIILQSGTNWSSTNSIIRCFSGVSLFSGSSFTYVPSLISGDSIRINEDGNYYVEYCDASDASAALDIGISLNNTGSADISLLNPFVDRIARQNQNTVADIICKASSTNYLHSGDVLRAMSSTVSKPNYSNSANTFFYCRKL